MKTKFLPAVAPRSARKGIFSRLQTRVYRLPAHITREDDWKVDSPNIRLSRVFGIVLAIHLVAIGGLMAYEMFRHKDGAAGASAAMKPALREKKPPAPSTPPAPRSHEAVVDDPANAKLATHVVGPGEKLGDIAQRYQVEETALLLKNKIGHDHPFESGMKLIIPERSAALTTPTPDPKKLLATGPGKELVPIRPAMPAAPAPAPASKMVPVEPFSPDKPVRRAEPVATPRNGKTASPPANLASVKKTEAAAKKAASPKTTPTASQAKGKLHIVKEGENAYRIARNYGVEVDKLIRANGIKPDALQPGTTLMIPAVR